MVKLYQFPASLCSQKVRLALVEKGVEHRQQFVDIELRMQNYEPWYVRLNPHAVVPTLVHGDRVVTDSARIIQHIDETFGGPPGRVEMWRGGVGHSLVRCWLALSSASVP